jgi:hypothetical protein
MRLRAFVTFFCIFLRCETQESDHFLNVFFFRRHLPLFVVTASFSNPLQIHYCRVLTVQNRFDDEGISSCSRKTARTVEVSRSLDKRHGRCTRCTAVVLQHQGRLQVLVLVRPVTNRIAILL